MLRFGRIFLSLITCAPLAPGQGHLVAIPEAEPTPALLNAVRDSLELESEPLRLYLGREAAPEGFELLDLESGEWRWDPALAERMLGAESIVLSGGSFLEWYDALLADQRRMHFTGGLIDALREGTHLVGCGGAAAFLSRGTSILRADLIERSDSRPRNPRVREKHSPVVGLGLGPPGYIDAAAFGTSDTARLMQALDQTHIDLGWWVAPDTALLYDYSASSVRVVGPGHAVLFDLRRARRQRERTTGARLSVLVDGEGWHRARRRLLLPVESRATGQRLDGESATESELEAAARWTRGLLPDPPAPYHGSLRADGRSRWVGPDAAPRPLQLRLDWHHPGPNQEPEDSQNRVAGEALEVR